VSIWLVAGSLAGVLALAGIAWALGLGGGRIAGETEARRLAEEGLAGFAAERALVSSDGRAAIVRGEDGSLALLKVHGVHVAARRLAPPVEPREEEEAIVIDTGERMFGDVRLRLDAGERDTLRTML
jgi:hypothetical protein